MAPRYVWVAKVSQVPARGAEMAESPGLQGLHSQGRLRRHRLRARRKDGVSGGGGRTDRSDQEEHSPNIFALFKTLGT